MKINEPRFYSSVYCNAQEIAGKFNNTQIRVLSEAEEILKGRIRLLKSEPFVYTKKINWLADPITNRKLRLFRGRPFIFSKDQNLDIKHVFELNRQKHLMVLGKAHFFSKENKYETEILDQIHSWIKYNRYCKTINWLSPLELSIRIITWIWTISFINQGKVVLLDQGESRDIVKSIYEQTKHIEENLQNREYPNNHLIGELAALVIVGIIFPHFPDSGNWLDKGLNILGKQIFSQIFADGVDKEQALDYHRFVLDFYTHVLVLCDRNSIPIPKRIRQRLEKMYEALLYIVRPDGYGPMIGDDDNGKAVPLSHESGRYFLSALSTGAVIFNRGDFKYAAREFHEESLWLLGLDGYRKFHEIKSERPHATTYFFQNTGLLAMRTSWSQQSHYLCFDCGPQGMGTGGHSHADGLSFEFSAFGIPLMIDPGTYVYNGSREWRDFFRSTSAHNTVVIDGLSQAEHFTPYDNFGWSTKADSKTMSFFSDKEFDFISGFHDGYKRLTDPVRHVRSILYVKNEYWMITDILEGKELHKIEWPLHFVEGADIRPIGDNIYEIIGAEGVHVILFFTCDSDLAGLVLEGSRNPIQGWVSYGYGEKQIAPVLNINTNACLPVISNMVMLPFKNKKPVVLTKKINLLEQAANDLFLCLKININGASDYYLTSNTTRNRKFSSFVTDAETILIRLGKDEVVWKCIVKNGSYLMQDGVEIFRLNQTEEFMVWESNSSI